jgi:putative spermidine/putrescine transport system substrate-binding protein
MTGRFLWILLLASVLVVGTAGAQTTVTVCSYGGTYNEGLEKTIGIPFTEATGIKVIFTTRPSSAQMLAQVKSGNIEWDIVDCESRMYARGVKDGIFEPVDLSMINVNDFEQGAVGRYGVGLNYFSLMIAHNTEKWPAGKGPKSMKDLWDVKRFPGPRTMPYSAFRTLEAALLADGVPRDKLYPLDVERAFRKMTELKPSIRVFWKSGGDTQTIMRQKEADLGFVPGGRMMVLAEQGVPVTWEWGDQVIVLDLWAMLKGTKNKAAAMKFIAFSSEPKRQAAFAEYVNYGPANKKAYAHIAKEKAMLMPTYPEHFAKGIVTNAEWWAEHEEEIERRWEAWKMK